jgi:hypothetical protein
MIFGDIERLLAQLYPYRVPIAIGLVIAVGLLVYVARRRHWSDVVRRHPRASVLVAAVVLAVGIPVGWVLGSPLFIRTELAEVIPLVASEPASGPDSSAAPVDARILLQGEFQGADEFHFGSGQALLVESGPGQFVLRFEEFSVRNGPDLFVYLSPSPDGYAEGALELGPLKASDGSFNYEVPAGMDITTYRSAVVWCRAFSVLFATAPLTTG